MFSFTHPHHSFNYCLYIITSLTYFCQCQLIKRVPSPILVPDAIFCNTLLSSQVRVSFGFSIITNQQNTIIGVQKRVYFLPKSFIYQKRRFQFSLYKKTAHHLLITGKLSIAVFFSHYLFNFNRYCTIFA